MHIVRHDHVPPLIMLHIYTASIIRKDVYKLPLVSNKQHQSEGYVSTDTSAKQAITISE